MYTHEQHTHVLHWNPKIWKGKVVIEQRAEIYGKEKGEIINCPTKKWTKFQWVVVGRKVVIKCNISVGGGVGYRGL